VRDKARGRGPVDDTESLHRGHDAPKHLHTEGGGKKVHRASGMEVACEIAVVIQMTAATCAACGSVILTERRLKNSKLDHLEAIRFMGE